MPWLIRSGDVLATAEIARDRAARRRGLIGRREIAGAFVLQPCRHVHTLGMRIPVDVALCDRNGRVLHTETLAPWRLSSLVRGTALVVEAEAGAFERWSLYSGDVIEVKE
ncbi:MAG: DUF192 domain-containing protein [Acidimicrobiia bacterium]